MVTARSAAMAFNRIVDARWDALNPRTANREIPAGKLSAAQAWAFLVVTTVAFVASTWPLGWICFALSPVALAIVFWYSLAKRVTSYTQFFLGLAMAVAPVGGWLAAGGGLALAAVLAGPRHRHLGRRLRRALRLPGRRRSIARTGCARSRCGSASAARC